MPETEDRGTDGEGTGKVDGPIAPAKDVATGDIAIVKTTKVKKNHGHGCSTEASKLLLHRAEFKREPVC